MGWSWKNRWNSQKSWKSHTILLLLIFIFIKIFLNFVVLCIINELNYVYFKLTICWANFTIFYENLRSDLSFYKLLNCPNFTHLCQNYQKSPEKLLKKWSPKPEQSWKNEHNFLWPTCHVFAFDIIFKVKVIFDKYCHYLFLKLLALNFPISPASCRPNISSKEFTFLRMSSALTICN